VVEVGRGIAEGAAMGADEEMEVKFADCLPPGLLGGMAAARAAVTQEARAVGWGKITTRVIEG